MTRTVRIDIRALATNSAAAGDMLQAGALRECARVIAENAPRAEKLTDGWSVTDPNGGRWWPSEAADEEIEASADPAETALRICRESPMRGRWIA